MPTETPEAPPQTSNRFFTWMRSIGITRQPGWVGGVSAGIAERISVDPLIIRGIIVVIAVLGGPAILLYAAAWLLLPDRFDKIHLEQLIRGKLESPIVAIAALVVLSMLPVTQGFWAAGAEFWSGNVSAGRILWTILLIGVLIAFTVWIARRREYPREPVRPWPMDAAASDSATPGPAASEASQSRTETDRPTDATTVVMPPVFVEPGVEPGVEPITTKPVRPTGDATHEDFEAWREQQAAWKAERAAFAAQQAATAREIALQRAKERRAAHEILSAEYAEKRRLWRLANPRLSGALVAITVGIAILAGGIAALVATSTANLRGTELVTALGTATVVLGVCIVVAGAFGRRNGFIIFLSVVLVLSTIVAAFIPRDRVLIGSDYGIGRAGSYTQLVGNSYIDLIDGANWKSGDVVDIWQGTGNVSIAVDGGTTVRVIADKQRGGFYEQTLMPPGYQPTNEESFSEGPDGIRIFRDIESDGANGRAHFDETFGPAASPDVTVRIAQGMGSVNFMNDTARTPEGDTQ